MNLFLDDIRFPNMSHNIKKGLGDKYSDLNKWAIVRDYFEFIDFVENNFDEIEIISFDHDLACYQNDREYTGQDAVRYIINYCIDNDKEFPSWYIHSDNISGKANMISLILNYLKVIENRKFPNFRYYNNGIINNKIR